MKKQQIAYWIATSLVALAYVAAGAFDVAQPKEIAATATRLGYPLYFFTILGIWKIAAAVVIMVPGLPRAKEWAYAGFVFNLTGAAASHVYSKDTVGEIVTPLVILGIAVASWALRPANRKLAGPWV